MNPRLYWIPGPWKGRPAITSRPRGNDWLGDEVQGWRAQGVDVVVSLLEPHEVTDLGLEQESTIAAQHSIRASPFQSKTETYQHRCQTLNRCFANSNTNSTPAAR